jgi:hypothetical protein
MRRAFIISVFLIFPLTVAAATPQAPDKLIYEGQLYHLYSNPLESYYESRKDRPSFFINPDPRQISTGLWRGYIATWKIEGGALYLVEIESWICDESQNNKCRRADLKELFGAKYRDGKVEADWYSGELKLPLGEILRHVWLGYSSIYEKEIILKVESGKVVGKELIDNTKKNLPSEMELLEQELKKMDQKAKEAEQQRNERKNQNKGSDQNQ